MTIIERHADYLREHAAITAEVAEAAGIRSASTVDELPEWARSWGEQAAPAIVFPWRSPSGELVEQVRPDTPIEYDGDVHKYLWPRGAGAVLNAARSVTDEHDIVLIVEGTKQTWAAVEYAPANVAVYGVGGCRNWSSDGIPLTDLAVVEDKRVVVALDADSATNLDVYTAGLRIAEACVAEGASSVSFLRLAGVGGSNGLDDVLAKRPVEKRASYLARLIAAPKTKPADARPKPKRTAARTATVGTAAAGRRQIYIDGDRLHVINELTEALIERWNAIRMFDHGGVLSILSTSSARGQVNAPVMLALDKRTFIDVVQETAMTVRRAGTDGEGIAFCYPEGQTMDALMSRHQRYAPLDRIARVPFVRRDGSICQVNGYDEVSRTLLVMDDALADIHVPDSPTGEDVTRAAKLVTEDWLFDFMAEMPGDADRTNAVALALTPFVRGLVDVVPLAVIDGIGMGSGKNLFADVALAIPATGSPLEPLNWSQEDEENRKQITSAFIDGADVFVFDEAHHLHGASLARAITSAYWKDRKLGYNQMLGFPNMVTWVALGNNVRVEGDITRRVYRIAIRPNHPNPQDRSASDFRHPQIREWVMGNRGEIVQALLTMIRGWYAAGQPAAPKEVSFGSFERWERVVGGILHHAGFDDFLGNTKTWRSESSHDTRYWVAHVHWLLERFGSGVVFTCAEAREAMAKDPHSEPPPGLTDLSENPRDYNRKLGQAYHRMNERYFDGVRLLKVEEKQHDNKAGWLVSVPAEGDQTGMESDSPTPVGGSGGSGGISTPSYVREKTHASGARTHDTCVEGREEPSVTPSPPIPPGTDELGSEPTNTLKRPDLDRVEKALAAQGVIQPDLFDLDPAPATYPRTEIRELDPRGAVTLPEGVVALDIETASEEQMWARGPEFIRLCGYQTGDRITLTPDGDRLAEVVRGAKLVIGHNVLAFDLVALARNHGINLVAMANEGRVFDTKLAGILNDPPTPGSPQAKIQRDYSLDNLGARLLGATKTGDLKALAKEHGGFDRIPLDDERYLRYLIGDVDLTARLAQQLRTNSYVRREHRIAAIAARIRMSGFRVDVPELDRRVVVNREARARHLAGLAERYGLPTTKKDGKVSKSPHATAEGKAAIIQAFTDLGVTLPPTEKGNPSFGKIALAQVVEAHTDRTDVVALVELISSLNGVRTVYETVLAHLHGDRVHPEIGLFQASGRWSTTKPGLTVMGKRAGKYAEREVFLPEPGHVIVSADLSQVDARAIAALSQDPAYLAMFEPGLDLHREIATRVWGDPGRREDAKAIGHGWNYGMGIAGLARNAKVTEDVAREFDRAMREQFPALIAWRDGIRADGEAGRMLDNGFGRPMRVDPNRSWTQAPALMGQGCARDLMMEGLLRLPADVLPMLRAVVHDEVILSVPADIVADVENTVLEALSFPWAPEGAPLTVQIEAGLGERRGANWGDVYRKESA